MYTIKVTPQQQDTLVYAISNEIVRLQNHLRNIPDYTSEEQKQAIIDLTHFRNTRKAVNDMHF